MTMLQAVSSNVMTPGQMVFAAHRSNVLPALTGANPPRDCDCVYATMVLAVVLSYFQLGCSTPTVL